MLVRSTQVGSEDLILAKRDDVVPENFVLHLQAHIAGFGAESIEDQCMLAKMLWQSGSKLRAHREFAGAMSFSHKELDEAFGKGKFKTVNERTGMFIVSTNWQSGLNPGRLTPQTKAYWLSDEARNARWTYILRDKPPATRLLMTSGAAMRTLPKAVASKDGRGVTTVAWKEAQTQNCVKVDLDRLQFLRQALNGYIKHPHLRADWRSGKDGIDRNDDFPTTAMLERLLEATAQVIDLSMTDVAGVGYCPQWYTESASGRLYAKGINLQTAPSLVKQAALAGLWEYDFSNCHFSILYQMAEQHGYKCHAIMGYLADKTAIRQAIAAEVGILPSQVKGCLLMLLYGAKVSTWHKNSIPRAIGEDAAKRLFAAPLFTSISDDVAQARRAVLAEAKRTPRGEVVNAFGKTLVGKVKPAEELAHLLQGVEAKALQTALFEYPNELVLLQHDGFVATSQLSASSISAKVAVATGYGLPLEEKKVWIDFTSQFMKNAFQLESDRFLNPDNELAESVVS